MNIKLKVLNGRELSEQEVREEILLAETAMNANSKLRFHISELEDEDISNIIHDGDAEYHNGHMMYSGAECRSMINQLTKVGNHDE